MATVKLTREALARKEIGRTDIRGRLAMLLSLFFIGLIFIVPACQLILDGSKHPLTTGFVGPYPTAANSSLVDRIQAVNSTVLKKIDELEAELEETSFLRELCLPPLQFVFTRFLGQGNEKVLVGRQGTLFYGPGVDALVGPPFLDEVQLARRTAAHDLWEEPVQADPVAAIIHFKEQLAQRGIDLLLVPVPVKPSIEPQKLSTRNVQAPLANRSLDDFYRLLKTAGVDVFDSREFLARYAQEHGAAYLATDTHWLPGAMDGVARELAAFIAGRLPNRQRHTEWQLQQEELEGRGDISRMLVLPEKANLYPPQAVVVEQVLNEQKEFWQPERGAEVLLLGDSFTNIFAIDGLGWGRGAGFAEHLSYHLGTPLDVLARNDNGAYVTRDMLATELRRGRDRLAGKRLVIWQFAERELSVGDWRSFDLRLGQKRESGYYTVEPGGEEVVSGLVGAVSRSPRPGSVPYRDNIVTIHLLDIHGPDGPLPVEQALVYGWGMTDNVLTPLASLRPGDSVRLTLSSWEDVEGEYGSYRRSPLDDEMMELELPNWGVLDDESQNK